MSVDRSVSPGWIYSPAGRQFCIYFTYSGRLTPAVLVRHDVVETILLIVVHVSHCLLIQERLLTRTWVSPRGAV